jgi:ankyrin repeat protein
MEKLLFLFVIFIFTSILLFVFPRSSSLKEIKDYSTKKIGKSILRYVFVVFIVIIGIYISIESEKNNSNSSSNEEEYSIYNDPYYEEGEFERIEKDNKEKAILESEVDSIEKRSIQFIDALESQDFEVARNLFYRGVDFSYTNYDGWSALHIVAEQCNTEFIKLLLENGMKVDPDDFNTSPLSYMLSYNDENGSIGQKDVINGHTAYPRTLETVRILIDHGANPNSVDTLGMTPLMHAASDNNIEVMKLLIEKGVDINAVDDYGWTALMHASYSLALESTELLVNEGADTGIIATKNNGGVGSAGLDAKRLAEWIHTTHRLGTADHLANISALLTKY